MSYRSYQAMSTSLPEGGGAAGSVDDPESNLPSTTVTSTVFGGPAPTTAVFGGQAQIGGGLFGTGTPQAGGGGVFGTTTPQAGCFGGGFASQAGGGGVFGPTTSQAGCFGGGFGTTPSQTGGGGVFGPATSQAGCFGGGLGQQPMGGGFQLTPAQSLFGGGGTYPEAQDEDEDGVNLFGHHGGSEKQSKVNNSKGGKPQTLFYLVCGGEIVHNREKQSREHMKMIYNTIIEKGLAKEEQIMFVRGRGKELSSSSKNNFKANGQDYEMYGPVFHRQQGFFGTAPQQQTSSVQLPSTKDNAVVIFIGQGYYSSHQQTRQGFGGQYFDGQKDPEFGGLLFVDSYSNGTPYQPKLVHLKAKNTLFISVASYCGESFERAFKKKRKTPHKKELLAVCLSDNLHVPTDMSLGKSFAMFFEDDTWKGKSIGDFCQVLEDTYKGHPEVLEMKENVINYTQETYEEELQETSKWATGDFEALVCQPIPTYNWEMFHMVEDLKETVNEASVVELSTNMKRNLDEFIIKMEALRTEVIETNLHRPKPYEMVGDKNITSMTWKSFLMLD